ncbi:DUF2116 family Zn-ribbon domain-containing protein [Carboxylicivirga sp. RSCT41]
MPVCSTEDVQNEGYCSQRTQMKKKRKARKVLKNNIIFFVVLA